MANKAAAFYAGICYISVGANINPERNIIRALTRLDESLPIMAVSNFYRTKAIDRPEQPDYLNGVIAVTYGGALRALKFNQLRKIETALGRERSRDTYAPRPIDLDIILCGDLIVREPGLIIPDPDIRQRPFLVAALLDIDPSIQLPDGRNALSAIGKSPQVRGLEMARAFSKQLKERFES